MRADGLVRSMSERLSSRSRQIVGPTGRKAETIMLAPERIIYEPKSGRTPEAETLLAEIDILLNS